ncbi:MAG: transposase domain-containing protein [Pseudomonadota bacterium]
MSLRFVTLDEVLSLGCPTLPTSRRSLERHAQKHWRRDPSLYRKREGKGGAVEYSVTLLPDAAQLRLKLKHSDGEQPKSEQPAKNERWTAFEEAIEAHKQTAKERLDVLQAVTALADTLQTSETRAAQLIAAERGIAPSSIANWKRAVRGVEREDWLPALLPSWRGGNRRCACDQRAWDYLVSDMLRPEKPTFTKAYRRMVEAAKAEGWSPIPQERVLRRRYERDVPEAVKILAREGKKAARSLIPAQRRTVAGLHAMQAVNMDGHKFDVFVNWPGYDKPIRPVMIAIQDVFSRKILAWRVSDTENKETTALVIGDLVEKWGIPETLLTDNSRSFASKWITGRSKTRFRFKIKDSDPQGLLVSLGVTVAWATPGHGQAKPIERAFGDFATDQIAKHPLCSGAYTGNHVDAKPENYASKAMEREAFLTLVDCEIAAHNAREGRRTEMAKAEGLSFDQVFERSYTNAIIRWPTSAQKALWLCAAERVRCKRGSGEIHFEGNRYWHEALNELAGRQVTVRFDPDNLHQAMRVYDLEDRLICEAALVEDRGFFSRSAARENARDIRHLQKTLSEQRQLIAKLKPDDLASLHLSDDQTAAPTPSRPAPIKRVANGGAVPRPAVHAPQDQTPDGDAAYDGAADFEEGLLKLIQGGRS